MSERCLHDVRCHFDCVFKFFCCQFDVFCCPNNVWMISGWCLNDVCMMSAVNFDCGFMICCCHFDVSCCPNNVWMISGWCLLLVMPSDVMDVRSTTTLELPAKPVRMSCETVANVQEPKAWPTTEQDEQNSVLLVLFCCWSCLQFLDISNGFARLS